jgi:hypothetical protein
MDGKGTMSLVEGVEARALSFFEDSPVWAQEKPANKSKQNVSIKTFMSLLSFGIPKLLVNWRLPPAFGEYNR